MSNVLEIKEFEIEVSDAGTFAHFEAVVDEIRQGAPATRYDAPEFYPAHCVATVQLSDDDDLSAYTFFLPTACDVSSVWLSGSSVMRLRSSSYRHHDQAHDLLT